MKKPVKEKLEIAGMVTAMITSAISSIAALIIAIKS